MATNTKKSPTKKAPVKKAPAKRTATKKTTSKSSKISKQPEIRSFRLAREDRAFTSFQITRQTVYWIILVSFIIFVQLWILKLQIEVATLLDAQQAQAEQL